MTYARKGMKLSSLNFLELQTFCSQAQSLVGGRIQEIHSTEKGLGFFVWAPEGAGRWLFFDMTPARPFPVLYEGKRLPFPKSTKPTALFLKSHGLGQVIQKIESHGETGRVIYIKTHRLVLEIRLFPHGQNIIIRFVEEDKSISWHPVKDLPSVSGAVTSMPEREFSDLQFLWWGPKDPSMNRVVPEKIDHRSEFLKKISKKEKAIIKMTEKLDELEKETWFQLGRYLQEQQTLEVPEIWQDRIDKNQSLVENIENCFNKHKLEKKKKQGTLDRLRTLKKEVLDLQQGLEQGDLPKELKSSSKKSLLSQAEAKGRKLVLTEDIEAVIGKSAKDNLSILRKAKSWFLWLHIKDRPGAYGVISRGRGQKVSEVQIRQVCSWMLKESRIFDEGRVEFLVTECRHVQPIKGDKLGRVTHRQARVLTVES